MRQRKDPIRKAAKNRGNVKIEATASDGAENASDHFVTFFLVLGHRKCGGAHSMSQRGVYGKERDNAG